MLVAAGEAIIFGAAEDDDFTATLAGDELRAFGEGLAEKFGETGFGVLEFPLGAGRFHTSQTSQSLADSAAGGPG